MSAIISADGLYRYSLGREWGNEIAKRTLLFMMLNPSTADAETDDNTIIRCIGFAKREGYTALKVVNVFAYRETHPKQLWLAASRGVNIIGPENDCHIFEAIQASSGNLVCAWGASAKIKSKPQVERLQGWGAKTFCLGTTKDGHPRHPLYLPNDAPFIPFMPIHGTGTAGEGA